MKSKELFTVESGSYSDHVVHAVFDDRKTALAWATALQNQRDGWHTDATVGTIPFISKGEMPKLVTTYFQSSELSDSGEYQIGEVQTETDYPIASLWGTPPKRPKVRYVRAPCHNDKGGRLEVRGASKQAVLKVTSERIAMWKAGAWAGRGHQEIEE